MNGLVVKKISSSTICVMDAVTGSTIDHICGGDFQTAYATGPTTVVVESSNCVTIYDFSKGFGQCVNFWAKYN